MRESKAYQAARGLPSRVKYVQLVRRNIREKTRYPAQWVFEGMPYYNPEHTLGKELDMDMIWGSIAEHCEPPCCCRYQRHEGL